MLMLNVTICKFLLAGHGTLTVQTPSIRCRKEKHTQSSVFFFWKPASTYHPRLVSASRFALLLVIRKSNTIHHATAHSPKCLINTNTFQKLFQMSSLSVECSFLQIPDLNWICHFKSF